MPDPLDSLTGPGGPSVAPPTNQDTSQSLIGVPDTGYKVPTHPGGVPVGTHQASVPFSQFGLPAQEPQYHNGDEWKPAQDPSYVPILQKRLVEAGLLDVKNVRPGVWDQASANAYRTVLALANANGGTDHQALDFILENPTLGAAQSGRSNQLTNPADVKTSFQNAAQSLTGGDLPASETDAFVDYYTKEQKANAAVESGNYTAPMTAEAYIRANQGAAVEEYTGLQRGLEFYRMLGVI